jgi:hypothetical protein
MKASKKTNSFINIEDPLLNTTQAAAYLCLKPKTLEVWRCTKAVNLPFLKIGAAVRYRKSMLDAYLESRIMSGSEA